MRIGQTKRTQPARLGRRFHSHCSFLLIIIYSKPQPASRLWQLQYNLRDKISQTSRRSPFNTTHNIPSRQLYGAAY